MRNLAPVKAKANAHYTCQECGSTELIQAHHEIPGDDDSLIALCAECHSKRHPNLPRALFFNNGLQPYWHNKSASSLAKELGVHPRTIIRAAKRLEIPPGELSAWDEELVRNNIPKLRWQPHHRTTKRKYACNPVVPTEVKIDGVLYDINKLPIGYINLSEAARQLGINYVTLWRWRKQGKVTPVRILGLPYLTLDQVNSLKKEKNNQAAGAESAA